MKHIELFNEKQRVTAMGYYSAAHDYTFDDLTRYHALHNYNTLRLIALQNLLAAYKQHDPEELVDNGEDITWPVKTIMREICDDILETKTNIIKIKAVIEYIEIRG